MKRKIYNELLEWKNNRSGETAVLIEGARRIGKSYIVEKFAKTEYDSCLIIDFNKADKIIWEWFDAYLDNLDTLFENLQIHYGVRLQPRRSVIVFDEVEMCPRARAAIKYLVADGRYDYIETGSLISIKKNVKDIVIPSEEEAMPMFPMDFVAATLAVEVTASSCSTFAPQLKQNSESSGSCVPHDLQYIYLAPLPFYYCIIIIIF